MQTAVLKIVLLFIVATFSSHVFKMSKLSKLVAHLRWSARLLLSIKCEFVIEIAPRVNGTSTELEDSSLAHPLKLGASYR